VRSIIRDQGYAIHLLCISETLGDVAATYEDNATNNQSELTVHTINARPVGSILSRRRITALCYSNAPEGVSVNVIATGLDNGIIRYNAYVILLNLQTIIERKCVPDNTDYGAVGICN